MKAVVCTAYGTPDVLMIQEVEKPNPREHEVLVKVHATAVNSGDIRVRGLAVEGMMKVLMRMILGVTKPRKPILGTVFSGVVEQVGSKVKKYKAGDAVFGMTGFKFGTYAEYLTIKEEGTLFNMPHQASFDEAVSLVFGGQTAIHFLEKMQVEHKKPASILVVGATGSVGVAAIQIARYFGAEVTAVCSSRGKALLESLGFTDLILYDEEELLIHPRTYDFVFDAVGKMNKKDGRKLLKNGGVFKTVGGMEVASESVHQLELIKKLYECGALKPVIDRTYSLTEIVEAHRYVDTGRKKGNVIIQVVHEQK